MRTAERSWKEAIRVADERQAFAEAADRMKREFRRFAGSYASAVKSGAEVAGRRMLKAAEEKDLPAEKLVGKLLSAVKGGALHAGERLLSEMLDVFERKPGTKKKK